MCKKTVVVENKVGIRTVINCVHRKFEPFDPLKGAQPCDDVILIITEEKFIETWEPIPGVGWVCPECQCGNKEV